MYEPKQQMKLYFKFIVYRQLSIILLNCAIKLLFQKVIYSFYCYIYFIRKLQREYMDIMDFTNRQFFVPRLSREEEIVRPKNISLLINRLSILCLTTFYFGYCLVYISSLSTATLINVFGSQLGQPVVKGFLIGSLTLGAMLGSAISIILIPKITKRNLVLVLCIISLILQGVIQVPNIIVLFICRSLQGIISGIFMAVVPVYIGQLAPKEIGGKGIFGVFSTLFVIIGVMTAFSLNIILITTQLYEHIRWRIIFAVNFFAILIVTVCILLNVIPESPNSLIQNNKEQEARYVIGLFHKQKYIGQVYKQKVKQIEQNKIKEQQRSSEKNTWIRTFLAFEIPMMQQLTGINALVSQMGFVATAYNPYFGQFVPVIMGIVQFISAIYSMTCLAKTKRRSMVLTGNLGMGICSLGMGIVFLFINTFIAGYWIVILLIFLYMTIHGGTLIPAVWLYVPEVAKGNQPKYSSVTNWFMCSVTIVVFPIINENYGYAPMFLTFGAISIVLFTLNYFLMFETKQKIIQQIHVELRVSQLK